MIKKAINKCDYTYFKINQNQLNMIIDDIQPHKLILDKTKIKKIKALLKSSYQIYLKSLQKYMEGHQPNHLLNLILIQYKNLGKKFPVTILFVNTQITKDFRETFKGFLNDEENFRQFIGAENSKLLNKIIYPELKEFYLNFVNGFENGTSMHLYSNQSIIEIWAIIDRLKMMDNRLKDYL